MFIDTPLVGDTVNIPGIGAPFVTTVRAADEDTPESKVALSVNTSTALAGKTLLGRAR